MLRIILLSLAWGICSTCLVRPWFWIGIKNKNLYNDYGKRIGFNNGNLKREIRIEIMCFIATFIISMLSYFLGNRQNLWGSFPLIIMCFLTQLVWAYQGKIRHTIICTVIAISLILWIQDSIVGNNIRVSINTVDTMPLIASEVDERSNVKLFVSASEIRSLFKVDSASGPTYNNGRYIFTISGGDNGKGIVIINKDNYAEANFTPCSYDLDIRDIRSEYPSQKLKALYITISDDNIPYGLFATAKKNWFFGTYKADKYVMLNLITGETQMYEEEQLPDFATKR